MPLKLLNRRLSKASETKPEYEAYASCSELPLYNWIKLNVTGDHSWLLKSGACDDLSEVYEQIRSEYQELINDMESTYLFNLQKDIQTLDTKLRICDVIVTKLSERRIESLINILKNQLFMPFQYKDLDSDLKKTISRLKSDYLRLKKKEADYLKYFEKNTGRKPEEKDWYHQLGILSKWLGFQVNAHKTTLMQYAVYLNEFKRQHKV